MRRVWGRRVWGRRVWGRRVWGRRVWGRRAALAAVAAVVSAAFTAAPAVATTSSTTAHRSSPPSRDNPHKHIAPVFGSGGQPSGTGLAAVPAAATGNGIDYHGGPIMLGTTNVYFIWYGNWSSDAVAQPILNDLASNVGGSPYFNINTTYYDASNQFVSNSVNFAGSTVDSYSQGPVLTDGSIQTIVQNAISSGALPLDTNGVYFVLTSGDVQEATGFGFVYCGWHTNGSINGADIKYSFVGDPYPLWMNTCAWQNAGPNGGGGGDAMASVVAHELEEAVTDPDLNAWYDSSGNENADKCAWTFDPSYTAPNGAEANMQLGGRDYLIQRNWVNATGGYCSLSYP